MIQLTSPTGIRNANLPFSNHLSWDLEALGRELTRLNTLIQSSSSSSSTVTVAPVWAVRTVTASTIVTTSDVTILADATAGALTVTLLPGPTKGRILNISKIDSTLSIVTVAGNGRNIDGSASVGIRFQDVNLQLQFSGSEWRVI